MNKVLCFFAMVLLLSSCAHSNEVATSVKIQAAEYLNPDVSGSASPIMLSFYELKTPTAFKQATYFQLTNNASSALQDSLLDERHIEVQPKQHLTYQLNLPASVQYLGITAGYRDIDQSKWRVVVSVPQKEPRWSWLKGRRRLTLMLDLQSQALSARVSHYGSSIL